jgi:hypothetical protein
VKEVDWVALTEEAGGELVLKAAKPLIPRGEETERDFLGTSGEAEEAEGDGEEAEAAGRVDPLEEGDREGDWPRDARGIGGMPREAGELPGDTLPDLAAPAPAPDFPFPFLIFPDFDLVPPDPSFSPPPLEFGEPPVTTTKLEK